MVSLNARGHAGFASMLVFSVLALFRSRDFDAITLGFLVVSFSAVPDIDIRLEIAHRRYTHNIAFATLFGLFLGWAFWNTKFGFLGGFLAGFGGVVVHILGDVMTYMKFAPLYPISRREVALGLFRSNDPDVNNFFSVLGGLCLIFYILFVYANILEYIEVFTRYLPS